MQDEAVKLHPQLHVEELNIGVAPLQEAAVLSHVQLQLSGCQVGVAPEQFP